MVRGQGLGFQFFGVGCHVYAHASRTRVIAVWLHGTEFGVQDPGFVGTHISVSYDVTSIKCRSPPRVDMHSKPVIIARPAGFALRFSVVPGCRIEFQGLCVVALGGVWKYVERLVGV
jgi:hypothetical protein